MDCILQALSVDLLSEFLVACGWPLFVYLSLVRTLNPTELTENLADGRTELDQTLDFQ